MLNRGVASILLVTGIGIVSPAHAACNRAPLSYDLPAQRLDAAVQQLAHLSGCPVTVDMSIVADRRAPALKGRYTPDQALAWLIRNTGYTVRSTREGLGFDGEVLAITMSQARVLRTAVRDGARHGMLTPKRAAALRAMLTEVERGVPRQVNAQGMLTAAQKAAAIDKLEAVRAAVGRVDNARDWAAFKRG